MKDHAFLITLIGSAIVVWVVVVVLTTANGVPFWPGGFILANLAVSVWNLTGGYALGSWAADR